MPRRWSPLARPRARSPRLAQEDGSQHRAVRRQAPAIQAALEPIAAFDQPVTQGPLAPVQLPGGLSLGHAFQVAEYDRETELLRQPGKFLVDRPQQFIRDRRSGR